MNILPATNAQLNIVKAITITTIQEIFPHYYPKGAVDFFVSYHSDDSIAKDIHDGLVFLCYNSQQTPVGTVTVKANEICRLFVLPQYQNQGFGHQLLDFAENRIRARYEMIQLDTSLPAKTMYLKQGYTEVETHSIKTESGDFLCYDVMRKILAI